MPKTDNEHTELFWSRVDSVVVLILENDRYLQAKRNPELIYLVKNQFGVEERQAQRYIKEAKKEIRKFAQIKRDEAYTKALRDREFIFIKAKSAFKNGGDLNALRLALDTVKDREKFQDLYKEKENPTVINKNIDMNQLTEKQLEALAKGKSIEEVLAIKE